MEVDKGHFADWVASELKRTGKNKSGLAKALGVDPSQITRLLAGERKLKADEIARVQGYFAVEREISAPQTIPEMDVRAGAGGGGVPVDAWAADGQGHMSPTDAVSNHWGIPLSFVRHELRSQPVNVRIVEVMGDSMLPTLGPGDRIMIDTAMRSPSPPGLFAVFDGFGVVVKRLELIPLTSPHRVRLISDNDKHQSYEVTIEEAHIIGRVICRISVM